MALTLNIDYARSLDGLSITVTDNTGSGSTGYGGSNPAVGDFTDFNITVTQPDPITYEPTGTEVTVNAYPTLPSAVGGTYSITNVQLGMDADAELPDGVYKFTIEAAYSGDTEGTAEATNYLVIYQGAACCIESLIIDAFDCGCSGDSVKIQRLVRANLWLNSLYPKVNSMGEVTDSPIVRCEQWNKAAQMIRELNKICEQSNCGGCGGCN